MSDFQNITPYLEGAFLSAAAQDWQQTSKFLRNPDRYEVGPDGTIIKTEHKEINPLLGEHPSQEKMTALGALATAAQVYGYKNLPEKYKLPFVLGTLIPEAYVVNNNRKNGLPLDKNALAAGALGTLLMGYMENKKDSDVSVSPTVINNGKDSLAGILFNKRW